jgi:hypothetical protein
MKIFGVEILNEGSGISIDDAVTEMQATFGRPLRRAELGNTWNERFPSASFGGIAVSDWQGSEA